MCVELSESQQVVPLIPKEKCHATNNKCFICMAQWLSQLRVGWLVISDMILFNARGGPVSGELPQGINLSVQKSCCYRLLHKLNMFHNKKSCFPIHSEALNARHMAIMKSPTIGILDQNDPSNPFRAVVSV